MSRQNYCNNKDGSTYIILDHGVEMLTVCWVGV